MFQSPRLFTLVSGLLMIAPVTAQGGGGLPPGAEGPTLGPLPDRVTQADITGGGMTLDEIRLAGLKIFATPFNKLDGYGDGPMDFSDTTSPGGRPTLQNNGTFLRVNGLDSQTCMECHGIGSFQTVPFRFEVGGVGASSDNAIGGPTNIDVDDEVGNGFAGFNGRFINSPFLFGSGGVELLAKEMTVDLQNAVRRAQLTPGVQLKLQSKGIPFGHITFNASTGVLDTSRVRGVAEDLVVRPFGRKGERRTVRDFDVDALSFHFGMQPVEQVGAGVDDDNDGVIDEILIGEVSAMHIFNTNLERPTQDPLTPPSAAGRVRFNDIGCAGCHVPFLDTRTPVLGYQFPEEPETPLANPFYSVDLTATTAGFNLNPLGGIRVPLFSDLKRHNMGASLAEGISDASFAPMFITARLWGIADTAPYMHDGRALTLNDAILAHGGEGQAVRDSYAALTPMQRHQIVAFLQTLRTPVGVATDLY
jgi:hypothetical protein